jgi:predicted AAA+ superfamily ATPase
MAEEPVVVLSGPRTVGKSTLLASLAGHLDRPIVDLDDPPTREAVADDPGFFASAEGPVLVDEFQHVPVLLDAIKAELNRDLRPGRFVLTGSTRYTTLPQAAQALTGRVHVINVLPLSQGEIEGRTENFLERLLRDPADLIAGASSGGTSREEYIERILGGGFPLALRKRSARSRARWFNDYIELTVTRDVLDIAQVRQGEALPRLLRQLAAQTGQILKVAEAARVVGLEPSTAERYTTLLEAVFMIHRLPAWGTTLASRVSALPKVHLVDSGLAAWLLGLSPAGLLRRDASAITEFGHLVETFAVGEILKQLSWSDELAKAAHFRTRDGAEVDLILETWDGRIAAIEVKAGSRLRGGDLKGLRMLRDRLGERFLGGVVLNLGELSFRSEDRIYVAPLDRLWT